MRILLIQPAMLVSEAWAKRALPFLPLGLGSIAAVLRKEGHQVKILDAYTEGWECRGLVDGNWIEIGLPEEEVAAQIRRFQPQIVGFSIPFTAQVPRLHSLARWVKAIHPEIFVLCGGNHPTSAPAQVLSIPEVDAVVLGEAESTLPLLLQALENADGLDELEGVAYRARSGAPVIRPLTEFCHDLDSFPLPAYDLLPLKQYFEIGGERAMPVTTSRGCLRSCAHCSTRAVFGKSVRLPSAGYLLKQMRHLTESYGVRDFAFEDHAFLADAQRAHDIFDLLASENLKITWTARADLGWENLDEALLTKMKQSGGKGLHFEVGSGSRRVLQQILKKPVDLHQLEEVVVRALGADLNVSCHFLLGAPGETIEEIYETLNFAWKLRSRGVEDFHFQLATPFVGTGLRDRALQLGCKVSFSDALFSCPELALDTPHFSAQEISRIRDTAEQEFSSRGLVADFARRVGTGKRIAPKAEERFFPSVAPAPKVRPLRPQTLNYRRNLLGTN